MALKHMSQKKVGELTSAKEVADSYHAPFDATAKVMQLMAQKGFLRAEYGSSGGYQITKDLSQVSLLDLIEVIQGPARIAKCLHKKEPCEIEKNCNIISPVTQLNRKLNDFYQGVSVQELLVK